MKRRLTCDCCGAPLRSSKCEYCGAEYDFTDLVGIKYEVVNAKTSPLCAQSVMPLEIVQEMESKDVEKHVANDMARMLANEMIHYMELETYVRPEDMTQVFNGRVRVVIPE